MSSRTRIDDAFYRALNNPLPVQNDHPPGGFLPPSPPGNGSRGDQPSSIPLSRIPYALQLLDLPPDDDQVLSVFRNAATGWEDDQPSSRRTAYRSGRTSDEDDVAEDRVSLRDWRAVCAALMDDDGDYREGSGIDDNENPDVMGENLSSEVDESSGGGSSDEYRISDARSRKRSRKSAAATAGGVRATRKTRSVATRQRSPRSLSANAEITPRQQRECLQAFLLFFPGVPEEVAKCRRLGVREVNAAATTLNEKIKAEEIIEMLEAFSTSPDKSLSLSDFEKMMIATRLA